VCDPKLAAHLLVGFFFSHLYAAELRTSLRAFAVIPNNYRFQSSNRRLSCYSCISGTEQPMTNRRSLCQRAEPRGQRQRYFHRSRKTSCVTLTRNVQCKDVPVQDMTTSDSGGRAPLIGLSNTWRWMVESQLPVHPRAPQSRSSRFAQEKAPLPSPESKEANCQGTERFARHSITWSSCYIRKSDACLTAWRQYIYKKVKLALEETLRAQTGGQVQVYSFFNLGASWGWVANATPRPLYPRERNPLPTV
jgi:hypothetical protein